MAETNCKVESSNVLFQTPKLLDKEQLNLNVLKNLEKSPIFALFKGGVPVNNLLKFNCNSHLGLIGTSDKPSITDKLRVSLGCKDGGFFLNLGCKF